MERDGEREGECWKETVGNRGRDKERGYNTERDGEKEGRKVMGGEG